MSRAQQRSTSKSMAASIPRPRDFNRKRRQRPCRRHLDLSRKRLREAIANCAVKLPIDQLRGVIPSGARDLTYDRRITFYQILPLRIQFAHKIILLLASPLFDFLFARDRIANIVVGFVVDESIHFVAFYETTSRGIAVIPETPFKTVCNASVQHDSASYLSSCKRTSSLCPRPAVTADRVPPSRSNPLVILNEKSRAVASAPSSRSSLRSG